MRKIISLVLFSLMIFAQINVTNAQEKKDSVLFIKNPVDVITTNDVFTVVENPPSYPGGDEARVEFLVNNIIYPDSAKMQNIHGTIYISFIIEKNGSISNIKVLRGIGGGCDEEAVRVVKLMPNWIPGTQRGKPVRVQFNMPFKFTLSN